MMYVTSWKFGSNIDNVIKDGGLQVFLNIWYGKYEIRKVDSSLFNEVNNSLLNYL